MFISNSEYLLIKGGESENTIFDTVLRWNPYPPPGQWIEVGAMAKPRAWHAVSIVAYQDVKDFCN